MSARVPECQEIKQGGLDGLDQNSAECFGRLIFATVGKSVGLKGLTNFHCQFLIVLSARATRFCTGSCG